MKTLQRERRDGAIEIVRLDRPAARNAMDTTLLRGAAWRSWASSRRTRELRALVLSTTTETALSAGADVREELDAAGGVARMELFTEVYAALDAFPGADRRGLRGQLRRGGGRARRGLRPAGRRRQPQARVGGRPARRARSGRRGWSR